MDKRMQDLINMIFDVAKNATPEQQEQLQQAVSDSIKIEETMPTNLFMPPVEQPVPESAAVVMPPIDTLSPVITGDAWVDQMAANKQAPNEKHWVWLHESGCYYEQ